MIKYNISQVSYWIAYKVIPRYVFQAFDFFSKMWTQTPTAIAPFYYLKACQEGCVNPAVDDAKLYSAESGVLGATHNYYLMTYPTPAPIDLSGIDLESVVKAGVVPVLAPHFSVAVQHRGTTKLSYFVLGQAPMEGGTTLRTVTARGDNSSLGIGPEPIKQRFLDRVLQVLNATN